MSGPTADAFDLTGKVALVTGSTRGIGREIAFALGRLGADVVISSRKTDACERVAAELAAYTGRKTLAHACHMADWGQVERLVEATYSRFGRLDIVVNNAGMSPLYDGVEHVSEELFDKTLAVNLKGPFRLCALAGARMAAAGGGSIVNISSVASVSPSPEYLPYAAAKAGLNAITMGFAMAFGPQVRVNCVLPGRIRTDVSMAWDMDSVMREVQDRTSLKRIGEASEVVGAVVYLVSDLASYTTGSLLRVDGGAH